MRWILKLIGLGLVVLFFAIVYNKNKTDDGNSASSSANHTASKGYTLQPRELYIMNNYLKDEMMLLKIEIGMGKTLSKGLLTATAVDIAKSYEADQVAADQKYFKRTLLLAGEIESINSDLGHEPYIVLRGAKQFSGLQLHFDKANMEKISLFKIKKIPEILAVCKGGGAISGALMFNDCQFPDEYAKKMVAKVRSEIAVFLEGKKPQSRFAALIAVTAITIARALPEDSPCFTNEASCTEEFSKVNIRDTGAAVRSELLKLGLQVPEE